MIENINDGYFVYGLIDPFTNEMRYVGFTRNLKERLGGHCRPAKLKINSHKNNWIKSIIAKGIKPIIIELEKYDNENDALQAEIELIEYYKYIGCRLTNRTKGGDKGVIYIRTDEVREKTSKSNKGRKHTEEAKRKIGEASKARGGTPCSDERKKKLSIINTGKKQTEENIIKAVKNNPNTKLTKEDVIKIKELYATGNFSQDAVAKMFNTNSGKVCRIINGKAGKYAK